MKAIAKRIHALLLTAAILLSLAGCAQVTADEYKPIPGLDTDKSVTLTIAIPTETDRALTLLANNFMNEYPNVNVVLKYVENYSENAVSLMQEGSVDIILMRDATYADATPADEETGQAAQPSTEDYYYNFADDDQIDFSDTNPIIMGNYTHTRMDDAGNEITYLYAVPLGGEVRGVFVNTTLLDSLGLALPTNYTEFLNCCEVLKQAGYVPIQGNPSTAAVALGLPESARDVVNNEQSLEIMRTAQEGVSALFEKTAGRLYELACKRYYDYKYIEEVENQFHTTSAEGQAQSFLGLSVDEDTYEIIEPGNKSGTVAFYPYSSSAGPIIQKMIDDNNLYIEFQFIIPPMNDEGTNSAVYFTMYYGICANKNSENLDWAREFVNYAFDEENNKMYAENSEIIPNTTDALQLLAEKYGVDGEKDCVLCGQIKFSDEYNGYKPLSNGLVTVFKCSAEKYMAVLEKDEDGNIVYMTDEDGREYLLLGDGETPIYKEYIGQEDPLKPGFAFCTLDYYLEKFEELFSAYRK